MIGEKFVGFISHTMMYLVYRTGTIALALYQTRQALPRGDIWFTRIDVSQITYSIKIRLEMIAQWPKYCFGPKSRHIVW
jgi:hypothetical protein